MRQQHQYRTWNYQHTLTHQHTHTHAHAHTPTFTQIYHHNSSLMKFCSKTAPWWAHWPTWICAIYEFAARNREIAGDVHDCNGIIYLIGPEVTYAFSPISWQTYNLQTSFKHGCTAKSFSLLMMAPALVINPYLCCPTSKCVVRILLVAHASCLIKHLIHHSIVVHYLFQDT